MSFDFTADDPTSNLARFRARQLIQALQACRGVGTSVITLAVAPCEQIALTTAKLTQELSSCAHIKSDSNRASVRAALQAVMARLQRFGHRAPSNGVVIFAGIV